MITMNESDVEDQRPKCGLTDDDRTQKRHEQVLTTMVRRKYCSVPAFESAASGGQAPLGESIRLDGRDNRDSGVDHAFGNGPRQLIVLDYQGITRTPVHG